MSLPRHQSRRRRGDLLAQRSHDGGVVFVRQHSEMFFISREDGPSVRTAVMDGPGTDLLDRALIGWERFLSTLQGVPDE